MSATLIAAFAALALTGAVPDDETQLKDLKEEMEHLKIADQALRYQIDHLVEKGEEGRTAEETALLENLRKQALEIRQAMIRKDIVVQDLTAKLAEKGDRGGELRELVERLSVRLERMEEQTALMHHRLEEALDEGRRRSEEAEHAALDALRRSEELRRRVEKESVADLLPPGRPVGDPLISADRPVIRTPDGDVLIANKVFLTHPDHQVKQILKDLRITVQMEGTTFEDALQLIRDASGLNIRISPDAEPRETRFDFDLRETPVGDVLTYLTEEAGMTYCVEDGAVRLLSRKEQERREVHQREQELETRSQEIARSLREARRKETRKELQAKLRECLQEQFDLRIEIREAEIADLERKIDGLREEFERRISQKERLIQRRLEALGGTAGDPW